MHTVLRILLVVVPTLLLLSLSSHGQDNQPRASTAVAGMRSADRTVRMAAYKEVRAHYDKSTEALMNNLINAFEAKGLIEYDSPLHVHIRAAGRMRAERTIPILAEEYIFQKIDKSTMPPGAFYTSRHQYPAADALGEIGGPEVVKVAYERILSASIEEQLRVSTWILSRAMGEEPAKDMLQHRYEQIEESDKHRPTLRKALDLLAEGEERLLPPLFDTAVSKE